jgi:[amino group carrier protein]-lysine/ornithine hydrolase
VIDETALLQEMLAIPSPSGQEAEIAGYLRGRMAELGFRAYIDEVGNAVGEIGQGEREIVLLGHIDTVEGHIPVRQQGDLLYGRGAVDAKGPMATFILAAAQAQRQDLRVTVIGAVEEEAASSRGARNAVQRPRPEFAVIGEPSGWAGITLGYKGRMWVNYLLERSARHSAGPGRSVCEDASDFWQALRSYTESLNCDRRAFDTLDPSLRRINSSSDGLTERVEQLVSLRVPLAFDADNFRERVLQFAGEARCTFSNEDPAFRSDKSNPLVRAFLVSIREAGGEPRFKLKTGTSDMNVLGPAWGCPMVAYGPGDSSLDHTPDEHISLSEFRQAVAVLTNVLKGL